MASAWGNSWGAAFGSAWGALLNQPPVVIHAGGGEIRPRKKTQPRPAWLKPIAWALEDDEIKPQADIQVGDVALLARKRRQREEQELLLLRSL